MESVEKKAFDKSEYYNEEGEVIYCEDTEILFQGSPGGREGNSLTIAVFSGNLWHYTTQEWPWSHNNMLVDFAHRFSVAEDPAEYFTNKYSLYSKAWMRKMPAEVMMFLLSKPFRLIPSEEGRGGLHAAIKIHDDPEKGKELIEALNEACTSYRKYISSSRKLDIHGYIEGPRRPATMMMDAAIRMREKLDNIGKHFSRIRWLEYNIRFRNNMEEWEEYFGEETYHQEWVDMTTDSFMQLGKILGREELANEEEED
jgi:hypothetical protein